jgi:hypothetical protein
MCTISAAPAPAELPPPQLPTQKADAREERPTVARGDSGGTGTGGAAEMTEDGGRGDAKISDADDADWQRTRPRARHRLAVSRQRTLIVAEARRQTEAAPLPLGLNDPRTRQLESTLYDIGKATRNRFHRRHPQTSQTHFGGKLDWIHLAAGVTLGQSTCSER